VPRLVAGRFDSTDCGRDGDQDVEYAISRSYRISFETRLPNRSSRLATERTRIRLGRNGSQGLLLGEFPARTPSIAAIRSLTIVSPSPAQNLSGNITSTLPSSPTRVLDLAVAPDGSKLVCVGRADTTEPHTIPSRQSSRSATPQISLSAPLGARHEKRISVYDLVKKELL
jgi:hypothetical protein